MRSPLLILGALALDPCGESREAAPTPPVVTVQAPLPTGTLPEVCKPWQSTFSRLLPTLKNPAIEGERSDRFNCWETIYPDGRAEPGECEPFAFANVSKFSQEQKRNTGGWDCKPPFTADLVPCTIELRDADLATIERVYVTCDGTRICPDCCKVTKREKVYEPMKPLTEAEKQKFARELWENRKKRFETCKPWCSRPEFASQCSDYWAHVGEPTLL